MRFGIPSAGMVGKQGVTAPVSIRLVCQPCFICQLLHHCVNASLLLYSSDGPDCWKQFSCILLYVFKNIANMVLCGQPGQSMQNDTVTRNISTAAPTVMISTSCDCTVSSSRQFKGRFTVVNQVIHYRHQIELSSTICEIIVMNFTCRQMLLNRSRHIWLCCCATICSANI
jgi:hypothetical protein